MLSRVSVEDAVELAKGANVGLRDLGAELGSVTVVLETHAVTGEPVDADVSVLLLGADGKVRTSDDFVFYNQPVALSGAVHLRDKIRPEDVADPFVNVMTVELDDVPEDVHRLVIAASLDPSSGQTFGDASSIVMRLQRSTDARDLLQYRIDDAADETALLFGEIYRRDGYWRVRAVGQGYRDGLPALIADHGVEVLDTGGHDADAEMVPPDESAPTDSTQTAQADVAQLDKLAAPVEDEAINDDGAHDELAEATAEAVEQATATERAVSVRRPSRAPRLPANWDASVPAGDATDWQPARLFPVAGIGGAEEQERRATSALLAVMGLIREFGRSLTSLCGAPAGAISTFVEVPFGHDEEAVRPDGAIRVRRGGSEWVALIEVKTGDSRLKAEQIDRYLEVARARDYDAVVTISNELTGASGEHPLGVDRRKLRKVALVHLPWDRIRAEATMLVRHDGVADATQRRVLEEFVRYMAHPRSGMHGFTDMGPHWVRVRDSVKAKTARPGDRSVADVSSRFDQLIEHVGHELSGLLGVRVQALVPRNAPDNVTRCQQLADSGEMIGCLRIPGAAGPVIVNVDLRADHVGCSITIDAPREGRPSTKVNWLLRQLPQQAPDKLRVQAIVAGGRGASTATLLGKLRTDPMALVPSDGRDIRALVLSLDTTMGQKRSGAAGGLSHSVRAVTIGFYANVVQHLRPWSSPVSRPLT